MTISTLRVQCPSMQITGLQNYIISQISIDTTVFWFNLTFQIHTHTGALRFDMHVLLLRIRIYVSLETPVRYQDTGSVVS